MVWGLLTRFQRVYIVTADLDFFFFFCDRGYISENYRVRERSSARVLDRSGIVKHHGSRLSSAMMARTMGILMRILSRSGLAVDSNARFFRFWDRCADFFFSFFVV